MNILGINSFFEHPSVALIRDGELVFAAEDERFTGIKHGRRYSPHRTYLPVDAMYAALKSTNLTSRDLDGIAYSYDSVDHVTSLWGCLTGRRLSSLSDELSAFVAARNLRSALKTGYEIPERYRDLLDPEVLGRVPFREWKHHLSHAASTFFCSGFDHALVVVCDGAGERDSTTVYVGRGATLEPIARSPIPHSLGLFYSFVTKHLGFEPFADEYKIMALAAYGEPRFDKQFEEILALQPNGRYTVDMRTLMNLAPVLGPKRAPGAALEQLQKDIAASAQRRLEAAITHIVRHHVQATGLRRLCLAGGTFLNCVANGKLAASGIVDEIFVQPASYDAGTAIGAAALSFMEKGGAPQITWRSMALGTSYDERQIEAALIAASARYERLDQERQVAELVDRLSRNEVGALFRGRMEFGPRALGQRSIIAGAADPAMRDRLNYIKTRESFRPVAPMIPEEKFSEYFEGQPNRYMLFTARAREQARAAIPSALHVDGTARVQTVNRQQDPFLHSLLTAYGERTGLPVIINTSFNMRGKPIIENPVDALASFYTSQTNFMLMENFLVTR